jgi:ariadne-1
LGRRKQWSDNSKVYLRYVKLACLEFATSPTSGAFLQALNKEHAVLLCILFADHESMHGRIAASYLKRWSAENSLLPLSVATSILVLIIGETQAKEVLDSSEIQNGDNLWEQLLGLKCNNRNIQRLAIDWPTSLRAGNFLIKNSLKQSASTKLITIDRCNNADDFTDESYMALLVDLSLKLSEVNDDEHKFLAIQLVSSFFCHLQRPKISMILKVFDLIFSVLTILANSCIGEDLRTPPHRNVQTPAGIPRPFHNRNDLNYLLQSHRQSMKRKNLSRGNAVSARKDAYELIPLLTPYIFERSDASRFQLPILLLQCIVFEEKLLENRLIKALDSTLAEYEKKIHDDQSLICKGVENNETSLQQQAIFILPALLEAICSESVNVRINAIKWIQKLLVNMDAEAASYLAAHLVHDQSSTIAQMAKDVLEKTKINLSLVVDKESFSVSMIDLNQNDGLRKVQSDLKNRSKMLTQRLQISHEESMVLLLHFKFSVTRAELEYRTNPAACRELCGLVFEEKMRMNEDEGDYVDCGICYEEMEVRNSYYLRCGHTFCKTCWISYVTEASNETSSINFLDLRCPHHECSTRVTLHDLQRLKPCLVPKWNNAIIKKFIEEDASYRYCSGPDCGCVAMRLGQSTVMAPHLLKVECETCNTSFCFGCGQNAHSPASCVDIAKWNILKGSSQFWIKQNSKPCPGCNAPIQKNTGCNHMHCSNCKTDFCWLCLSLLNSHLEPHTCVRYDSADSAENDFERQAMYTTTRYEAHDAAAIFTLNQFKSFDPQKWLETYWFLDEDGDPEKMTQALKVLLEGRDFLKNSYVAMLGLAKDTKRLKLHDSHHECLEMFTEQLSHLTETNLHRQYELHGHIGIRLHFRKLAFYTASVAKYMERMSTFIEMQTEFVV